MVKVNEIRDYIVNVSVRKNIILYTYHEIAPKKQNS